MTWLVSTANGAPAKAYDSQLEAEREVVRVKPTLAVAWWCEGVEEGADTSQAVVMAPVSDLSGGVGSKVIRKLLGRQIEDSEAS